MKHKKKVITLIILAIILTIIPNICKASSSYLEYKNIDETCSLTSGDLFFYSIRFRNFADSSEIFGLSGIVQNNGSIAENFVAKATFYDENYNLIATLESNQYVPAYEKNSYSNVGNISEIKKGYTVNDICYYSLEVQNSTNSFGGSSYSSNKYDYEITSYDINMVVNENNTFDITETITAYFNIAKHGIFRKIPLRNSVARLDGTESKNRAQISNIEVSDNYKVSNEDGYKVIKIGDANTTLTGSHTYTIKYTYNIGKDPLKDVDELYFNLIGEEWDTTIDNITFKITMPKEFDESQLGFSCGSVGSTNSSNVDYSVYDKEITGSVKGTLTPKQALTVRLTLPEGYFVGAGLKADMFSVFVIILSLVFLLISYMLWKKYGKDDEVIETVEFYPPEGYNPAELGFLYKGKADNEDIVSLLIYLANKGYLKIEETENKVLFLSSKGFKITKLKEYDGDNACEEIFFEGLFKGGKQTVTENDLYDEFYKTLGKINSKINSRENRNKIFEKISNRKIKWIVLMIITIFCLITIKPVVDYSSEGLFMLPFALIFPGVGFTVLISMVFGQKSNWAIKIFGLVWGGMFGGMPWLFIVLPCLLQNIMYLITYIIGIICIAVMIIISKHMPKRTPYGNEILGKIKGFKRFLETAEKEQLESLVMDNPEYFYNILPYTYVLGVSDKWINQFETIALKAPDWYDAHDNFSVHNFGMFVNSTMSSASSVMSSSPSSSSSGSSGGSSGGGSSGGGSGGGGGGSW